MTKNKMPMKNRHTKLVCRGLHKLREELRAKEFIVMCIDGWMSLKEVK